MKSRILLFLVATSFAWNMNAQCELPFGDLENWYDLTAEINPNLPDETLIMPLNLIPLFRSFDLNVDSIFQNTALEDLNTDLFGLSRTDESRTGEYAMKIGGEALTGYTDLGGQFGCNSMENVNYFSFYYKHYGENPDTLFLQGILGESFEYLLTDYDDPSVGARFTDRIAANTNENESWNWVQLPVENLENGISLDTMILVMVRQGAASADDYWVIDDFQWNIETPVVDVNNEIVFQLGQSLDSHTLYVQLNQEEYNFISYTIFDANSRQISPANDIWQDQINVQHLSKGSYFLQVTTEKGIFTKPFIKF